MRQINLLTLLYDERTPGESDAAMARLLDHSWVPVVELLEQTPAFRVAVRMSGHTLSWASHSRPELLRRIRSLAERRQIEVIGGALMDAPLHLVPRRDAVGQLQEGSRAARRLLGARPHGAWLAQGAWDGSVAALLALGGLEYTFLDEGLVAAGLGGQAAAAGWVAVERQGHSVGVFPLDRRLARLIPLAMPQHVIRELRSRVAEGERLVTVAVPIEAFGYGPRAARWCWEGSQPWMPVFVEAVQQQAAWLKLSLPRHLFERTPPVGRSYPVAGTSPTVGGGLVDVEVAQDFASLSRAVEEHRAWALGQAAVLLHGPPWEAVLARYDEANQLHKRMLRASRLFHQLRRRMDRGHTDSALAALFDSAREHLYKGQCAGILHTGFNGGLAEGAVRHAAWLNLVEVERLVMIALGERDTVRHEVVDHDGDGQDELVVRTPRLAAVMRPGAGGALSELHLWELGNLANTLSRRLETWHSDLARNPSLPALVEEVDVDEATSTTHELGPEVVLEEDEEEGEPDSALTDSGEIVLPLPLPLHHDVASPASVLWLDRHRRGLFVDHFYGPQTSLENVRRGQAQEEGDFVRGAYQLLSVEREHNGDVVAIVSREGTHRSGGDVHLLRIAKRYRFSASSAEIFVDYDLRNRIHQPIETTFGVELTLNLDGRPGPHRFLRLGPDHSIPLERSADVGAVSRASLILADIGTTVHIDAEQPARVLTYPVEAAVRGRTSYRPSFQGTCLVFLWPVALWSQEKVELRLALRVERR